MGRAYFDDFRFALEDGACQWRLPSVINSVWISAVLDEEVDEWGVAVVGC